MEDDNLAALIQSGKIDEFFSDEKVQNLIQDDGEDSGGIPVIFLDPGHENRFQSREDKTSQTYFPTDLEDNELLKPENSVYQFRIDLDDIRPPIWRRILIPGTSTLRDLHHAIQDVMGWGNYHLHQFMVADPFSGNPITMENHDEETEKIEDWFAMESPYGRYIYDFGDNWEHILKLEVISRRDEKATYPQCTKGKRACPPEDCGGVGGYLEMLDILEDPEDEEYLETVEWLGEDFNPEKFNPEDVVFRDIDD
ncbi:MAG TPA: plasmid pRiA4b ORF-3 family protein [Methanobacterium subterraneum]|uniref:Plasmid pRiA4b ORF-3 family protein n=1 Tax=Methanobacterium subterraneum TaxID=59277 RepID=A0A7J4TJS8_9EURY|nr:plasmid pRiA4b ORF-3 family protein [Methanobacterium subterraneum]